MGNTSGDGRLSLSPTNLNNYLFNCSDRPNNALTDIRPLPARAAPIYDDIRPTDMMPDHQRPGHGVLVQAAISRTPPEINGIKWQQMALYTKKFVSGTVPLATNNR